MTEPEAPGASGGGIDRAFADAAKSCRRALCVIGLVWLACWPITYSATMAEEHAWWMIRQSGQNGWDRNCRKTMGEGWLRGAVGPVGLLVTTGTTGFFQHGLRWWC